MIFRYPGGKDRLARKLLKDIPTIHYADISDNETSVYLNDLDDCTAAFWEILISSEDNVIAPQQIVKERIGEGIQAVESIDSSVAGDGSIQQRKAAA